jgi:hypothetical protein
MSGFWARLWGNSEAVKEGISILRDAGDALVYTKEEQAHDQAADATEARKMLVEWIRSTQGSNLARRIIALSMTFTWLLMYIASMGLNVSSIWGVNPQAVQDAATIIGDYADGMNGAVMMVLLYYFAAPHMGKGIETALNKFGKQTPRHTTEEL